MPGTSKPHVTTLWSVIEKMQRRLEAEGLDRDVVDAAVARGLEALLDIAPPVRAVPEEKVVRRIPLWAHTRAPAKA